MSYEQVIADNREAFRHEMETGLLPPSRYRPDPPPPKRRARRWYVAACLTAAAVLAALAPPLPHEPWLLGGFAAGYAVAVLDRLLARGTGRHRA